MVPYGYSVKLYKNDGLSGENTVINGASWTSEEMNMQCQNVPGSFNDSTSSLAVYRTEFSTYAVGDWVSITATEGIDYTYH